MASVSRSVHRRPPAAGQHRAGRAGVRPARSARARRYKGLCPFHSEKTPSFHVNPDKGFFHCFGCGVGGDVFKFLELHEKVGFQDAVRMLAQKFGVALPEPAEGDDDDARRDSALREALLKVHEIAAAYFQRAARGAGRRARAPAAGGARRHGRRRSSSSASGYAPPSRDGLKSAAAEAGLRAGRAAAERPASSSARTARSSIGSATG